ncbi:MAG: FAD-dependent oxidoreductase, partial [Gemmatimonadaceae bacterium]|nr:FAD-dependent oxidoreductase [Gemmatimonadaceae bacterium]
MSDASDPREPLASELPRRDFLRLAGLGTGALLSGVTPLAVEAQEPPIFPVHTGRRPRGTRNNHVVVVGAGAWGAFIAWHLRKEGNKVTVVEQYGAANSRSTSGDETRGIRSSYGD